MTARARKKSTLVLALLTTPIRIRFRQPAAKPAEAECPKCGTARGPGPACPRCGLATANMDRFRHTRDEVPEVLEAAWKRTLAGWDDPARHDELLAMITQHDAWAWGARCYREVARQRPDDEIAARHAERLRKGVEATLLARAATRDGNEPRPYRATTKLLVAMGVLIALGLGSAALLKDRVAPAPTPPTATAPAAAAPAAP